MAVFPDRKRPNTEPQPAKVTLQFVRTNAPHLQLAAITPTDQELLDLFEEGELPELIFTEDVLRRMPDWAVTAYEQQRRARLSGQKPDQRIQKILQDMRKGGHIKWYDPDRVLTAQTFTDEDEVPNALPPLIVPIREIIPALIKTPPRPRRVVGSEDWEINSFPTQLQLFQNNFTE